jgi:lipopolysaccharide export system ATP-binding protein
MMVGLVEVDGGNIFIDQLDVTRMPMYHRARLGIGYLPQEASIFRGMNVEDNIYSILQIAEDNEKKRRQKLEELLEEFSITHIRKSHALALSGGERRRVEIARALATNPSFILLDEPFAGVDPIAVNDIRVMVGHLKNRGIGVLITDHNVRETLSIVDRAYIVYDGMILTSGSKDAIVENEQVRKVYLGEDFRI